MLLCLFFPASKVQSQSQAPKPNTEFFAGLVSFDGYQSLHIQNPDHRTTTFGLISLEEELR
jgi:hypothetical protein